MVMRLNILIILLFLSIPLSMAVRSDILINGTNVYLATGESSILYQGYVLSLKSVSSDGSMWFQLHDNDTILKSEIVYSYGTFVFNKSNKTILSFKVEKVYSGPSEQNLVSFFLYQFNDPEKSFPDTTIVPGNTVNPGNNNTFPKTGHSIDPLIWVPSIAFVLLLFYVVRKLW